MISESIRRNVVVFLAGALLMVSTTASRAVEQAVAYEPLRIELLEARQTDDTVTIRVSIINQSRRAVRVPTVLIQGGTVFVDFLYSDGTRRHFLGEMGTLKPFLRDQFMTLAPNRSIGGRMQLNVEDDILSGRPSDVEVRFVNWDDGSRFGIDAWTGEVVSLPHAVDWSDDHSTPPPCQNP